MLQQLLYASHSSESNIYLISIIFERCYKLFINCNWWVSRKNIVRFQNPCNFHLIALYILFNCNIISNLTYFWPLFHFYNPWKDLKPLVFWCFQGLHKQKIGLRWINQDQNWFQLIQWVHPHKKSLVNIEHKIMLILNFSVKNANLRLICWIVIKIHHLLETAANSFNQVIRSSLLMMIEIFRERKKYTMTK